MIVLSSASAVRAVMDKQGGSTGGRPRTLLWPIFRGLYVAFESQGRHRFRLPPKLPDLTISLLRHSRLETGP